MRILDRRVYRRSQPLRALPGHPPRPRPRRSRGVADRPPRRAFIDGLLAALPGLRRTRLLVPRAGRLRPPPARGRRHLARARARARRDRAAEPRRRERHLRQDAQRRRRRASTTWSTSTRSATSATPPATSACACSARCCPTRLPARGQRAGGLELARGARLEFIRFAQRRALGPSTASLVRAAEARDIPWLRLNDQSLVQFGHGKYQQRIQATVTGRTPHIAVEIASDKEETNQILATLGLPVPQQRLVQSEAQADARRATPRLPGRRQAARRQPRSRRLAPPHDRRGGAPASRRRASTRAP